MRNRIYIVSFLCILLAAALACNLTGRTAGQPTLPASLIHSSPTSTPFEPAVASPTSNPSAMPTAAVQPSDTPSPTLTATPTAIPTAAYSPEFEPADCRFSIPADTDPECGYLVVPENRAASGGRSLRLHVAIFRSVSANPQPDPVIYLSGGPGSSALELARYMFATGIGNILDQRDLIFFDQRGTGYSEPDMSCPERSDLDAKLLAEGTPPMQAEPLITDAYARCRDRLRSAGIDLSAYNSAASAADINDLRLALGYDQVNLYGVSYGTRLALTVERDFPQALRSVILDSTYPPQVNLYTAWASSADRAFNELFRLCADDSSCNQEYPNLKDVFYNLVDRLNANPAQVRVSGYPVRLSGNLLMVVLFSGLYNRDVAAMMPKMIYQVKDENYSIVQQRLGYEFSGSSGLGMQMSVQCYEEVPFNTEAELEQDAQGIQPQIAAFFPLMLHFLWPICSDWGAGTPDPRENQPVVSDIPTLILSGSLDPITPPAWGQLASQTLSRSYFEEIPGIGHWTLRSSPCALNMALGFLNDPASAPDSTCIDQEAGIRFTR